MPVGSGGVGLKAWHFILSPVSLASRDQLVMLTHLNRLCLKCSMIKQVPTRESMPSIVMAIAPVTFNGE